MFIRSTGLGRTLLLAKVSKLTVTNIVPATLEPPPEGVNEPKRLLVELQILEPVHWTVRAFVEPPDLKEMVKLLFKNPGVIWQALKFLVTGKKETPAFQTLPKVSIASDTSLVTSSGKGSKAPPPPPGIIKT
ncbi:MAG: hypothetical protein QXF74_00840 [Nitrososphaerota archaeon]